VSLIVYKSYAARVDFDAGKVCLVGKITGVEPEITFYGKTLEEIQSEFHKAVDQYLAELPQSPGMVTPAQCSQGKP